MNNNASTPHWLDSPQTSLEGKTAREGYAANTLYAEFYTKPQSTTVKDVPSGSDK